jgi:hypothetical protein
MGAVWLLASGLYGEDWIDAPKVTDEPSTFWGLDTTKNSLPHVPWCEYEMFLWDAEHEILRHENFHYFMTGRELIKFDPETCSELANVEIDTSGIWRMEKYHEPYDLRIQMIPNIDIGILIVATSDFVYVYEMENLRLLSSFSHHISDDKNDFSEYYDGLYRVRDLRLADNGNIYITRSAQRIFDGGGIMALPSLSSVFSISGELLYADVPRDGYNQQDFSKIIKQNEYLNGFLHIHEVSRDWGKDHWFVTSYNHEKGLMDTVTIFREDEFDRIYYGSGGKWDGMSKLWAVTAHRRDGSAIGHKAIVEYQIDEQGMITGDRIIDHGKVDLSVSVIRSYIEGETINFTNESLSENGTYFFETGELRIPKPINEKEKSIYPLSASPKEHPVSEVEFIVIPNKYRSEDKGFMRSYQYFRLTPDYGRVYDWIGEHYMQVYDSLSHEEFKDAVLDDYNLLEQGDITIIYATFSGVDEITSGGIIIDDKQYRSNVTSSSRKDEYRFRLYLPISEIEGKPFELVIQNDHYARWISRLSKTFYVSHTGVSEPDLAGGAVFPNPIQIPGWLDLSKISVKEIPTSLSIYDSNGQEVFSSSYSEKIYLDDLSVGSYYIILTYPNNPKKSITIRVGE